MNLTTRNFMNLTLTGVTAAFLLMSNPMGGAAPITEEQAHAIGVDAYIYLYPLVTMDLTRKQSVNIEPGKEFGKGPMNMFVNLPAYPQPT